MHDVRYSFGCTPYMHGFMHAAASDVVYMHVVEGVRGNLLVVGIWKLIREKMERKRCACTQQKKIKAVVASYSLCSKIIDSQISVSRLKKKTCLYTFISKSTILHLVL